MEQATANHPQTPASYAHPWRVLLLLFLANLLNFYDRVIPSIIVEPLRAAWGLSDFQLGLTSTAFTTVYALSAIYFGKMADRRSRAKIMGWGLAVWSALTALSGAAWNFTSYLLIRMGVGVGEACYAPAATSMIGDIFPPEKKARAMGIFMLGLPLGILLSFSTVGYVVSAFDSWRAPFLIASVPGLLLAIVMFSIKEPERGAAEGLTEELAVINKPIRYLLKIATMRWMIVAGLCFNFATYAVNAFMVPLLQRYFDLSLQNAATATGLILGGTGLLGLLGGGFIADGVHKRWPGKRLLFAGICMVISALFVSAALFYQTDEVVLFVSVFSAGWLFSYTYFPCVYSSLHDVVVPQLRATAFAVFMAALYLLGGGLGPIVVGLLSDFFSVRAQEAAGSPVMLELYKAQGLHDAMWVIPVSLVLAALAFSRASKTARHDMNQMAGTPGDS